MIRPSFSAAWAASQRIYDPANSGAMVAKVIGGYVEKNINNPDPKQRWNNTCAVRMSYILNHASRTCYDHCYFNEPAARYRTDRANFWSFQ